ncbi:toprim domain-containing protein [Massilia pseudoviolaceinigra]|uniref:toprim domain-containing protein n=1 Tax=Massilia pseudoviolaceinigra TaxID=3057165 RepID=UPI0027968000|nr:toprim domain-containing protein [Massilia sp. CCM 9206]MDQ1924566.1 toprim domain-containing protein [Massilia sp. CCM 9206]
MSDFLQFVQANGIIVPDNFTPGRWIRCKTESHPRKKNGSIKLADDGLVGWCQDYAVHAEPVMWRASDEAAALAAPIDRAAIARRQVERRDALCEATLGARAYYDRCAPLRDSHPYLVNKGLGVAGCVGLRVDADGWLVVPMLYNGKILSLQRISSDGEKKFHFGATTKSAYYAIERPGAAVTVLVEGFATGLTIFQAIPNCRVIVAFNAGNLPVVAERMDRSGMGVVCADNDHETAARIGRNPGLDAAHAAAALLGVGVSAPTCKGTDWNDYAMEQMELALEGQAFSFSRKRTVLQMQASVFADIKLKVMREARLLRTK